MTPVITVGEKKMGGGIGGWKYERVKVGRGWGEIANVNVGYHGILHLIVQFCLHDI